MMVSEQRTDKKERGTMSLSLLRPAVKELAELHRAGRVYGRLGPESVVVRGHIWFGFSLSQETARAAAQAYRGRGAGGLFVTLAEPGKGESDNRRSPYVPLEQMLDGNRKAPESDVYSLCAVLYQMITGTEPPDARSRISGAEVKRPSELGADISASQEEGLLRGLAVMEKDRYADGTELYLALYGEDSSEEEQKDSRPMQAEEPEEAGGQQEEIGGDTEEALERLICALQNRMKTLEENEREGMGERKKGGRTLQEKTERPDRQPSFSEIKFERFLENAAKTEGENKRRAVLRMGWRVSVKAAKKVRRIIFLDTVIRGAKQAWDVSEQYDGSVMAWMEKRGGMLDRYYDLYIGAEGGVAAPEDSSHLFAGFKGVEEISFQGNFDTSGVKDMKFMFFDCGNLRALDMGGFDTSQATDMSCMFSNCQNLRNLDVSGFDTAQVTNMRSMFSDCQKLVSLDVSGFDTGRVTDMNRMFSGCRELRKLDVSGFDTSQAADMVAMFAHCESLTELDVSGFSTARAKEMQFMFWGCSRLTSLDISHFDLSHVKHTDAILPSHLRR